MSIESPERVRVVKARSRETIVEADNKDYDRKGGLGQEERLKMGVCMMGGLTYLERKRCGGRVQSKRWEYGEYGDALKAKSMMILRQSSSSHHQQEVSLSIIMKFIVLIIMTSS